MRVERFSLALARPLDTARGRIDAREGALVRVAGGDGPPGVGETTPLPGWTEDLDAALAALDDADEATPLSALAGTPAARHGLATARLDAAARAAGESLAAHLADGTPVSADGSRRSPSSVSRADTPGRPASRVPVNATVGAGSPEETAEQTRDAVAAGFDCLKLKVGARSVAADAERLRAARAAAPDATLRADANGAWDEPAAREALAEAGDVGIEYVEQPLPAADLAGHRRLREATETPVALDESLAAQGLSDVLAAEAADLLVLKPMALGGPDRTVAAARRAREAGLDAVVTTTIDGVVARTTAVHAAAAIPDVPACGLATGSMLAEDLYPDPAPVERGAIRVPDGPGLAGAAFE
ncbi:MAG: enolase C-terminal domain-like protein [Haloferacaceae archaeon]